MSYRGPQAHRISAQTTQIMQYAGHSVTWKQYVSATANNDVMGLGDTLYYRNQSISAHMTFSANSEAQYQLGQVPSQTVYATTRQKLGSQDELVWNGVVYRVEGEPMLARVGGHWTTRLKQGDS